MTAPKPTARQHRRSFSTKPLQRLRSASPTRFARKVLPDIRSGRRSPLAGASKLLASPLAGASKALRNLTRHNSRHSNTDIETIVEVPILEPTPEQKADFEKVFLAFDQNKNGTLSYDEISEMLTRHDRKVDCHTIQNCFDAVDLDGSGSIGKDEFFQMLLHKDVDVGIFSSCAKKLVLQAKKLRLKQWSMVTETEKKKATIEEKKKQVRERFAVMTTLLGTRSKLMWRTNTRLDINVYETTDSKLVVQTSSPPVSYPLIFLKKEPIVAFLEKESKEASNTGIIEFIVSRVQVVCPKASHTCAAKNKNKNKATTNPYPSPTTHSLSPRKTSVNDVGRRKSPRTLAPLADQDAATSAVTGKSKSESKGTDSYIKIVTLAKDVDCDIVLPESEHTAVCINEVDLSGKHEEDFMAKVNELNHHIDHVKRHARSSEKHHASLTDHMNVMKDTLQVFSRGFHNVDALEAHSPHTIKAAQKFKQVLKRVGSGRSSNTSSKKYQLDTRATVG